MTTQVQAVRFYTPSGEPTGQPYREVATSGPDYTDRPTVVRVYDGGFDPHPWDLDGADASGYYTEACWSFATEAEATAAIPAFVAQHFGER